MGAGWTACSVRVQPGDQVDAENVTCPRCKAVLEPDPNFWKRFDD